MWVGALARPRAGSADYIAEPQSSDSLSFFRLIVSAASQQVQGMSKELERQSAKFPTAPALADLTPGLSRREESVKSLIEIDAPRRRDQWAAVKRFLKRYPVLVASLS